MTNPIDVAYVEIRADGSKFGPDVVASVDREMARSGKAIKDSITKPVEDAGKQSQSIFAGIGQSISNGLRPGITQVNNFRAGFNDSKAAASAFTGTMGTLGGKTRTVLNPLITGVQNFHAGLTSADAASSAFTGRIGSLGGAVSSTFRTSGAVVRDFGNIGSQVATRVGSAFDGMSDRMHTRFSTAVSAMRGTALTLGAALGVGGIGALIGSGISRISDIEQTTKSLTVMTGSAEKAKDMMNQLLSFAKTTPFAFPDISEIGRNLITFGVDGQKVVPTLKALGDAASASGQGVEGLRRLGDAIGNVALQGKISGEDIQSFTAVGVPALQILANTAGVSVETMSKRISKGTVDSKFAMNALVTGIEEGTNGIAGATARMGGIMASQKDTIAGTMDSFKSSVTSTMATLLTPVIPLMRQGINTIGTEFKRLPALIITIKDRLQSLGFFDAIKNLFAGVANIISAVWPALQQFGRIFLIVFGAGTLAILRAFGAAFQWIGDRIRQFLPVIQPIAAVLGAVWGATMLLRTGMMLIGGAMLVWKGIMIAFGPIMKIFTALQWALNIAMNANPISLIIIAIVALVAAFVILWNKSAGFRLFWIGLWQAISSFFISVWDKMKSVFTTVIDALTNAWNATWKFISDVISAVWNGFIKPIFDAIVTAVHAVGDAAEWLYQNVINPVFNAIVVTIQAVGAAAQWLWQNVLSPVFNFIGAAAVIMGKILLGVVLIPLVAFWQFVLQPAALFLWHNVIEPVFQGIANVVSFVWNSIIKPIFDLYVWWYTEALPAAAMWLWHNVIEPVWNGIGNAIKWVYDNILTPIWEGLKVAWEALQVAAHAVADVVTAVWNAIGNAIRTVVNNVIQPIITFLKLEWQGIQIAGDLLWRKIQDIWNGIGTIIRSVWNGIIMPAFDAIKNAIGKVGDAFVNAKSLVERVWGQLGEVAMKPIRFVVNTVLDDGLIAGWNKVVDFLHLGFLHIPPIPRLATGGIIPGYTPGRDTHLIGVGGGEAVMRPEWTRAAGAGYVHAANAAARNGGVSGASSFIARNGLPGFADGGVVGWIGNALGSVGNFISGAWNGVLNFGGQVIDFVSDPVGGMEKLLNGIIGGLNLNVGDVGKFADLALQAPKGLVGGMVQKIRDWWNDFMKTSAAATGGGGGAARWAPQILQVLAMLGQPASLLPNVIRRMNQESGGNPNAINNWDSNAIAGHPSQGLMQTIPGTFAAYAGPFKALGILNPLANIYAGLNYALHRYPSLQFAMDKPGGYANGGWLMPGQFGFNETRTPEAVLNGSQWAAITSSLDVTNAARELMAHLGSGGSVFEDFSFRGMSENLASNNDLLANLYYNSGGQFDTGQMTQFLSTLTSASTRASSAAREAAVSTTNTNESMLDKLDALIALTRQGKTIMLNLNGNVLATWFQETEIMGGL